MISNSIRLVACICVISLSAARLEGVTHYTVFADSDQVVFNPSSTAATAVGTLSLNDSETHLSYAIQFNGLDLEPDPANRTDPNDIVGMHIHFEVPDVTGPHILNIFGFPSHDDADLVVDYQNESLSGVFDMSDASIDPDTGEPLPQFFPLTTKLIGDWIDELNAGQLYLAVHTVEASPTPPGVAIRGAILPVPEPKIGWAIIVWGTAGLLTRRRRV